MIEWGKNYPEEFYKKCVEPLLSNWKSKPEKILLEFCKTIIDDCKNYFLKDETFSTKTKNRQIDIFSENKNIIVEFDGPLHFEPIFGEEDFRSKKKKDSEINALSNKYCIIRVSYDCYNRRIFNPSILNKIEKILLNPLKGLYLIGDMYGKS